MAIYYVDLASGNDANAGTAASPLLTINAAIAKASGPHDIRVAQTAAHTTVGGANTWTWTVNSTTVSVNADVTASVAIGDYIGKPTVAQGTIDTFYRVASRTFGSGQTTIILSSKHQGTSGTTTGALKASFVTTGTAAASAVTVSVSGTQISGSWDLATETQTGRETWAKSNNARTVVAAMFNVTATNVSISKFNAIDTYYGIFAQSATATGLAVTDCNFVTYGLSTILNLAASDIIATRVNFQNEPSVNATLYLHSSSTTQKTFDNCWIFNGTNTMRLGYARSAGMGSSTSDFTFTGGTVIAGGTTGVQINSVPAYIDFEDTTVRNCTYGVALPSGTYIKNGYFANCTYGVYAGTVNGLIVSGSTFNGNTYGIGDRWFSGRIENCTFGDTSPNTVDIYMDQYSGNVDIIDCTTTAPTINFLSTTATATTMRISGLSIDSASASKIFNNPTGWNATHPLLIAKSIDTNGGTAYPDGYYFPYFYFVEDSSVTHSTGSSFRLQFSTASANNVVSAVPICQAYTESGVAKTFTYWIKANSGWAGTIIPQVRLNGKLIQTETTITSLTTSWVEKTVTVPYTSITEAGRIELSIIPNANTVACYIDDVDCVTP